MMSSLSTLCVIQGIQLASPIGHMAHTLGCMAHAKGIILSRHTRCQLPFTRALEMSRSA